MIWVFPKIGVPPKHPKTVFFSRRTHGFVGENPLFSETSIYIIPSSWHFACTSEAANNEGAISFTAEDKHRIELEPSSKQSNSWHPRPLAP